MQTLQAKKAAKSARAGKNKETCDGNKVVGFDGEGLPQKADVVVRMGRVVKKTGSCHSEKDAKCGS